MSMALMMVYAPFLLTLPLFYSWFGLRKTLMILGAALVVAGVVPFVIASTSDAFLDLWATLALYPFYVWFIVFGVRVVGVWRKFVKKA